MSNSNPIPAVILINNNIGELSLHNWSGDNSEFGYHLGSNRINSEWRVRSFIALRWFTVDKKKLTDSLFLSKIFWNFINIFCQEQIDWSDYQENMTKLFTVHGTPSRILNTTTEGELDCMAPATYVLMSKFKTEMTTPVHSFHQPTRLYALLMLSDNTSLLNLHWLITPA